MLVQVLCYRQSCGDAENHNEFSSPFQGPQSQASEPHDGDMVASDVQLIARVELAR